MIQNIFTFGVNSLTPMIATTDWLSLTVQVSLVLLVVALGLTFIRLILGPSLPDRVVALDLASTLLVGLIAVSAIETGDVIFLRVAMVAALFSFIGTIGFCWYLQRETDQ
ncbi:monovalent cation/H+ antiporter complex subunit F [Thalassoglobus polymorphus]|uniref:Na(+)/H(+) antiporter subunit F n=1 Tax=Thalassoglobus polymorphus TaxID=2527994 RepID=A0A517QRA8_9PLAN|nr:monovalent cation/H+ antiporter complex subunit F [Thalassoglobus polymorphus]QDT34161.1 Na(+)/H(+) antiporter subunit F [Thalassoglobus polymorphus]